MPLKKEIYKDTSLDSDSEHQKDTCTDNNTPRIGQTTNKNMTVKRNTESKG